MSEAVNGETETNMRIRCFLDSSIHAIYVPFDIDYQRLLNHISLAFGPSVIRLFITFIIPKFQTRNNNLLFYME